MAIAVSLGGVGIPSRDVASCSIRRGRTDELDRTSIGTASVSINIVEGRDNPLEVDIVGGDASIELRNPVTGGYSSLFVGFVDDAKFDVDGSGVVTRVEAELVDALDKFSRIELAPSSDADPPFGYEVPPGYAGQIFYEDAGQVKFRIEKALDEAEWPLEKRAIFTGNVSVQEMLYPPRTSLLQVIHDAADAEFPGIANFFVDKEGVVRFKGRLSRFNPGDPQYDVLTFPAGVGSSTHAQIRGLRYSRARSRIINAALFTPMGIAETKVEGQVYVDQDSINTHGLHSESAEDLQTETGFLGNPNRNALEETFLFGKYYVDNYKQPRTRVDQLVFKSLRPTDVRAGPTWDLICNVDLSHLIALSFSAPGTSFNESYYVEGLSYEINPLQPGFAAVDLTCDLSPQAYYDSNPF